MSEEKEETNFVRVKYSMSSTSQKLGYEIITQCSTGADEVEMKRLAELALLIAKGTRERLN